MPSWLLFLCLLACLLLCAWNRESHFYTYPKEWVPLFLMKASQIQCRLRTKGHRISRFLRGTPLAFSFLNSGVKCSQEDRLADLATAVKPQAKGTVGLPPCVHWKFSRIVLNNQFQKVETNTESSYFTPKSAQIKISGSGGHTQYNSCIR